MAVSHVNLLDIVPGGLYTHDPITGEELQPEDQKIEVLPATETLGGYHQVPVVYFDKLFFISYFYHNPLQLLEDYTTGEPIVINLDEKVYSDIGPGETVSREIQVSWHDKIIVSHFKTSETDNPSEKLISVRSETYSLKEHEVKIDNSLEFFHSIVNVASVETQYISQGTANDISIYYSDTDFWNNGSEAVVIKDPDGNIEVYSVDITGENPKSELVDIEVVDEYRIPSFTKINETFYPYADSGYIYEKLNEAGVIDGLLLEDLDKGWEFQLGRNYFDDVYTLVTVDHAEDTEQYLFLFSYPDNDNILWKLHGYTEPPYAETDEIVDDTIDQTDDTTDQPEEPVDTPEEPVDQTEEESAAPWYEEYIQSSTRVDDRHTTDDVTGDITGSNLSEHITGTPEGELIKGRGGHDLIFGMEGDDTIKGNSGDDIIGGGIGDDLIKGGSQDDLIHGDAGNDKILGGGHNDELFGDDGDDIIKGGAGNDTLFGGADNDKLFGNKGDDYLYGGEGDDILKGNAGNDSIEGGDGDDKIVGGGGDDSLYGGNGIDNIYGGRGNDYIAEEFDSSSEEGVQTFRGGAGDDVLNISSYSQNIVHGDSGNDWIAVGVGTSTIYGGDGDDYIGSDGFDNVINGGAGSDRIFTTGTRATVVYEELKEGETSTDVDTIRFFYKEEGHNLKIVGENLSDPDAALTWLQSHAEIVEKDLMITLDDGRTIKLYDAVQYEEDRNHGDEVELDDFTWIF